MTTAPEQNFFLSKYLFYHSQKASLCKVFHRWLGTKKFLTTSNISGTLEHTILGDMGIWNTCLNVQMALDVRGPSWPHLNNLHPFHWTKGSKLRAQLKYKSPDYTTEPNLQIVPMQISLTFLISSAPCRTECLFSDWSFQREKCHQNQLQYKLHL